MDAHLRLLLANIVAFPDGKAPERVGEGLYGCDRFEILKEKSA